MGLDMGSGNGSSAGALSMLDSHEDRLQRVEETCNDTRQAVTEISVNSDANHRFLLEKVESNHAFMVEKFESALSRIEDKLQPLVATVADLQEKDRQEQAKVRALEVKERERVLKSGKLRRGLWGVMAAGLGAIAIKFGDWLWSWATHR